MKLKKCKEDNQWMFVGGENIAYRILRHGSEGYTMVNKQSPSDTHINYKQKNGQGLIWVKEIVR